MRSSGLEYAAVLRPLELERPDFGLLSRFQVIYAGDEFCQVKLPSIKQLEGLRGGFRGRIALVSSLMTEEWLKKFMALVPLVNSWGAGGEIVVNDFGALYGLCRMTGRCPRISLGRVLVFDLSYFAASPGFKKMFGFGVRSAEIDNEKDFRIFSKIPGFSLNLHFPWKFSAFSRNCYLTRKFNDACGIACRGTEPVEIPAGTLKERLFVSGNCIFCENRSFYRGLGGLRSLAGSAAAARIVYNSGLNRSVGYLRRHGGR